MAASTSSVRAELDRVGASFRKAGPAGYISVQLGVDDVRLLGPPREHPRRSWVGFHSFRHYCATELFRRGLSAKQAQVWLGHHSPAFTLATYVHLLPDDLPASPFGPPTVLEAPDVGNTRATEATETDRKETPIAVAQMA